MSGTISFTQITFAVKHVKAMVHFYNKVLLTNLEQVNPMVEMYEGMLVNIPLLMCSNELAGVECQQSRHQLHLGVAYFDQALENVQRAGGTIESVSPQTAKIRSAIIRDPDGNTLELIEAVPLFKMDWGTLRDERNQ